jgi:predicted GNAT family N-acyltransferase
MSVVKNHRSENCYISLMAFSRRAKALHARSRTGASRSRAASLAEIKEIANAARLIIDGLAGDAVIERVHAWNRDIFQLIEYDSAQEKKNALIAYLPLNDDGLVALLNGDLDVSNPPSTFLCKQGDAISAIYVWLAYAPGHFVRAGVAAISHFQNLSANGCPIFARAMTKHSARLLPSIGFRSAAACYARAPADLLAVLPRQRSMIQLNQAASAQCADRASITVRVARTIDDIAKVFSVRTATYLAEQECPYDEEFDGNDFCATHFLGEINSEPAGCIRVRYFANFVKIERLAVRREFRSSRIAFMLARAAIDHCRQKGYTRAYGHARHDLTPFWRIFGFRIMPGRPPFAFSKVRYIELEAHFEPLEKSVGLGSDPFVLIRPEGAWDRPGPLDRSVRSGAAHKSTWS